jgi:hypothetical protein
MIPSLVDRNYGIPLAYLRTLLMFAMAHVCLVRDRRCIGMSSMYFVGNRMLQCAEKTYVTRIYRYPKKNGGFIHTAETALDSGDNIVSDGNTLEEALAKQRQVLPLALFSRDVLRRMTDSIPMSTCSEKV